MAGHAHPVCLRALYRLRATALRSGGGNTLLDAERADFNIRYCANEDGMHLEIGAAVMLVPRGCGSQARATLSGEKRLVRMKTGGTL